MIRGVSEQRKKSGEAGGVCSKNERESRGWKGQAQVEWEKFSNELPTVGLRSQVGRRASKWESRTGCISHMVIRGVELLAYCGYTLRACFVLLRREVGMNGSRDPFLLRRLESKRGNAIASNQRLPHVGNPQFGCLRILRLIFLFLLLLWLSDWTISVSPLRIREISSRSTLSEWPATSCPTQINSARLVVHGQRKPKKSESGPARGGHVIHLSLIDLDLTLIAVVFSVNRATHTVTYNPTRAPQHDE